MGQRVAGAAILVPVVVVVFLAGQPWLTFGVAALSVAVADEAFRLLRRAGVPVDPGIGVIAAPIAVLGMGLVATPADLGLGFVGAVFVAAAIAAFRKPQPRDGFADWVGSTFGALYASLLAFVPGILVIAPAVRTSMPLEPQLGSGRIWLLILVLTVWSFDSFAYLAGRTFKRGHFLNHISPNKTWSGVIGGLVAAVVVCGVLVAATGQSIGRGLALGVVLAIAAQSGDVAESLLKRAAGAKDSGSLIPGHGGFLDRVDSFLFAAPVMYLALALIAQAGPTTAA